MKIVFAHNVHVRFQTLLETITIEKKLFPDSISIVGYNVDSPSEVLKNFKNIEYINFPGITHKIGCTNGCITTIQAALKHDPDLIVFSHDDVMLNEPYLKVFKENAELIVSGEYDVICRKPMPEQTYGKEYYMMEVFCLSKTGAEKAFGDLELFKNEYDIPEDARGSISPEAFLYNRINEKGLKVLEKGYFHTIVKYNETLSNNFGYTHKNVGSRGWTD